MSGDSPRRTFFRVRVAVLLAILAGVAMWAWRDVRARRNRTSWDHTLHVAVVVLHVNERVDAATVSSLHDGLDHLADRLDEEMRRYLPTAPKPFSFSFYGPFAVSERPPSPADDGVVALAKQSWASRRYFGRIDEEASLDEGAFDSRIYVVVRPVTRAGRSMVEGQSEQGGRVGNVEVEVDPDSTSFALFVVAHELFHTLGATDKYDARGNALIPDGLAEPEKRPLLPQRFVEVMARGRPVAAGDERPPEILSELAVGAATAREIGWAK